MQTRHACALCNALLFLYNQCRHTFEFICRKWAVRLSSCAFTICPHQSNRFIPRCSALLCSAAYGHCQLAAVISSHRQQESNHTQRAQRFCRYIGEFPRYHQCHWLWWGKLALVPCKSGKYDPCTPWVRFIPWRRRMELGWETSSFSISSGSWIEFLIMLTKAPAS